MADPTKPNTRRVLVFGRTGLGKTSMLNELTGTPKDHPDHMVSNAPVGTTFRTTPYDPVLRNGHNYSFFDTAGLNENESTATVPAGEAIKNLISLLKSSKSGWNLMIMVVPTKLETSTNSNYELFVKTITKHHIPVLIVVTGCEGTSPIAKWATDYGHVFKDQAKFEYKNLVSTCFASSASGELESVFAKMRGDSASRVWTAIEASCSEAPVDFLRLSGGILQVFKDAWNAFIDRVGFSSAFKWVNHKIMEILLKVGVKPDEAKNLAQDIS